MSVIVGYEEQVREGQDPEEAPELQDTDSTEKEEEVCKWQAYVQSKAIIEDSYSKITLERSSLKEPIFSPIISFWHI